MHYETDGTRGESCAPQEVLPLKFDLHTHSTASDGTDTPAQLIERAAREGFGLIALTDHDTLSGLPEARQTGERLGVRVIPGVEISAGEETEVHVLGYGMRDMARLESELSRMRQARCERMHRMIVKLAEAGIAVDEARVALLAGDSPGRPHLARVLVEMGRARDVRDAFYKYLLPGRVGYVPREKLTVPQAIHLLRDCGAVPVIAHPGQNKGAAFWLSERLRAMQTEGLMGLEVYHMAHTPAECQAFDRLARSLGLLVTGGSDYHGSVKQIELGDGMSGWKTREQDLAAFLQKVQ